jgi:hypothetical protein
MRKLLSDLRWIVPAALLVALTIALLGPGVWWIGWLAYSLMLLFGLSALAVLWRSAGSSTALGLMLLLSVVLRLGLGLAFTYILPPYGNDTPVQNAGYIFSDSYQRDSQAWELAASSDSFLKTFDKSYSVDQYGGLLLISGMVYRFTSPDAHRPWLILLLAALTAAIGVALAYKAARKAWGDKPALLTGWIIALFPEAILLGSSQMREPFLMTFIAMVFLGAMNWSEDQWKSAAWTLGGMLGLLLFSPGVGVAAILILAVWFWLSRKKRKVRWAVWAGLLTMVALAVILFSLALRNTNTAQSGILGNLLDWFRFSINFEGYLAELNSGWLQNIFIILPKPLHLPFLAGYGILQPVLPAALADPAVWPMHLLGILRSLGWYMLLPFLVYSLRPILKTADKREKMAWLWLWVASWTWIILASVRAGGDQWDNPRYRAILLIIQAALAAYSLLWQRRVHDRWLGRFLSVEGVFLLFFGYWYFARYSGWKAGQVHIFVIIALILVFSIMILLGGWIKDKRSSRHLTLANGNEVH